MERLTSSSFCTFKRAFKIHIISFVISNEMSTPTKEVAVMIRCVLSVMILYFGVSSDPFLYDSVLIAIISPDTSRIEFIS